MACAYFKLQILNKKHYENKNKGTTDRISIVDKKCRICLHAGSILIFDDKNNLSEDVKIFGSIEIFENDNFPKYLCEECYLSLNAAIKFRTKAQESDKILRKGLEIEVDKSLEVTFSDNFESKCLSKMKTSTCKLCKKTFTSVDEFIKHNSKNHKNIRIQCTICYSLLTPQLYAKHLQSHKSITHLVCEVCGKLFQRGNLIRHQQLHSNELLFQCKQCPYHGRSLELLNSHLKSHLANKPYSCETCQRTFLTRSNLNRHLFTHRKERPYKCAHCNRTFYTKYDVQKHLKCDHVDVKEFYCKICGNKYRTKKSIMQHELKVHKREKMTMGRMPLYLRPEFSIK